MKEQAVQDFFVDLLDKAFAVVCHGQIEPDGKNCAICSATDHQAPECRFNAFNRWKESRK